MEVILGPEARAELSDATDWYFEQSPDVARRFVAEFECATAMIAESPHWWPEVHPGVRRVLFDKFPYALLYLVEDAHALVMVVKHHKRHPDYWKLRVR